MLRAIVEQHYQDDYTTKLERYLDLPAGSLKTEDTYDLHIRNYCARAADLSESRYYGPKGYQEEYKHYQLYFEALQYNLNKLAARIIEKGGYENIIRDMRLASIETLLTNAPLHINVCDDLPLEHLTHTARNKVKYESPYLNTYILRHSEYFDYESLYATDTTVSYIDSNQANLNDRDLEEHEYVPNEDEVSIINAYLKESTCTSPKTTSVV
jgi:hypothetical protein